jgi:hypothetical protein
MDIPVRANVHCTDGLQSRSIRVIVNPVTERVTHVVVKQARRPYTERLVPVRLSRKLGPSWSG